ncbi:MAG: hypothetical protein K5868_09250 [Lachnospiraceae bacterium]|nr:hypothetical protein [Lachnospiraceae bacterium]
MSDRMKLLPAMITLLAGACTSIITYLLHYEVKKALWILLIVLLIFYIIGIVVQKTIYKFEKQVEEEEAALEAEQEGKVVEKDIAESEDGDTSSGRQEREQTQSEDESTQDYIPEEDEGYTNTETEEDYDAT